MANEEDNCSKKVVYLVNNTVDLLTLDIIASSTRREDLILSEEVLSRTWVLRNFLADMNSVEAMDFLLNRLRRTASNEEFLISMND